MRPFDFSDYVALAQRASRPVDELRGDIGATYATLEVLVSAGELADLLKRQIFYRRPASRDSFLSAIEDIKVALDMLEKSVDVSVNQEDKLPFPAKILHGTIGTIGECGEMLTALLNAATLGVENDETDFDKINIIEEAGDALWYQAEMLVGVEELTGHDALAVADTNIAKLAERCGDSFSDQGEMVRDLVAERVALGGGT